MRVIAITISMFVVFLCIECSHPGPSQIVLETPRLKPSNEGTRESGSYPSEIVEHAKQMSERLKAEASTNRSHAIAGQYYQGDGLGANLTLTIGSSGEYTFFWYGCLGLYHLNYGTLTFDGTAIDLHPSIPRLEGDNLPVDLHLVRVPWGKRTYLIAPDRMKLFAGLVNETFEPRLDLHGMTYLKRGDEKLAASGDPALPAEWSRKLKPLLPATV